MENSELFKVGNNPTIFAIIGLLIFPLISYLIEKVATTSKTSSRWIFWLVVLSIIVQLVYPLFMIKICDSHVLMSTYLMLFSVGQMLKLISFHHVMYDVRTLTKRVAAAKDKKSLEELSTFFNINVD